MGQRTDYDKLVLDVTTDGSLDPRDAIAQAAELLIRQLGGRYQVKSPSLRPLYEEAVKLLNDFSRVKLVHVPREMNAAADEMSNKAIDERL